MQFIHFITSHLYLLVPTNDEWLKKMRYIMEYYLATKKNEILPFATPWIDLEGILLHEISRRRTSTLCFHLYVESNKTNEQI